MGSNTSLQSNKSRTGLIMAIYLFGVFIGALDTGIITPARTVIQTSLNVDEAAGIWMITIYTLAYAASIPIMGKLADKYGRKYIYLSCIFLFGAGSLMCGLSHHFGSFTMLIICRAIQAIGGGGILPVSNAEFGTAFPPEKRGMALGMVGGVYGIANVIGSSAGSLIMDIFGTDKWEFIFYINIPICIFIVIAGLCALNNNKAEKLKKMDILGTLFLTAMILSIMYGLRNIDFFNFTETIKNLDVYPFIIIFVVLLPFFIITERKAEDPIMNLSYFHSRSIVITLIISMLTGVIMMGMIFVPQFSENALMIPSGKGGYFVLILGVFSGLGAPVSGKMIDRLGVKPVLGGGLIVSILGSAIIAFAATQYPNPFTVILGLVFIGIGIGFIMGTPLNYMMLEHTPKKEANSALATLSLIRSVGTAIAPAIMVGFIAHAGIAFQSDVNSLLPTEIKMGTLPNSAEITQEVDALKKNPQTAAFADKIVLPDFDKMTTVKIDTSGNNKDMDFDIPKDVLQRLQNSDVTTITANCKEMAGVMFDQMSEPMVTMVEDNIQNGIDQLAPVTAMVPAAATMQEQLQEMKDGVPNSFKEGKENYLTQIDNSSEKIESEFQSTIAGGFRNLYLMVIIAAVIATLLLGFYRKPKEELNDEQ